MKPTVILVGAVLTALLILLSTITAQQQSNNSNQAFARNILRGAADPLDYFKIKLNGYVLDISGASSDPGSPIPTQPNKPTITIVSADDWVSGGRPLHPADTILVPTECMPNDGWPSNRGGCPFVINNGYVDFQVKVTSSSPIKSITCRMDNIQFTCHGPVNGNVSRGFVLTLSKIKWSSFTIHKHSFSVFTTDSNNNNSNVALFKFNTLNSKSAQQYHGNL